jgi:hypothetical protein
MAKYGRYGPEPVPTSELPRRFPERKFTELGEHRGVVDGGPLMVRPGGLRSRGYLVNIGLATPLGKALVRGQGYLGMTRGRCFVIPLGPLRTWLRPKMDHKMIDIYLDLSSETLLSAGLGRISVSEFGGDKRRRVRPG